MNMKFHIKEPETNGEREVEVELTLERSKGLGGVYLKANGAIIMGFRDGRFCRYSDAKNHSVLGTIKGLILDNEDKISEADNFC